MSRSILAHAAIAALAAVATACSGPPPHSASPTTGAATSASSAASAVASIDPTVPYGTYSATIPSGVNAQPGTWGLTITADVVSFTRPDGGSFSPGAVVDITATEIVLAPDPGCPVQEGTPTEGRYRWSREGDALRLELVSDSCQDRIDTLTSDVSSTSR